MGLCGSKEPASKYARRSHKHHHHGRHSHNRRKSVEYHARASLQQQHEAHPQHSSNQQGGPSSSDFARHSTPQQQNGFGNRPGSHLRGSVRGERSPENRDPLMASSSQLTHPLLACLQELLERRMTSAAAGMTSAWTVGVCALCLCARGL